MRTTIRASLEEQVRFTAVSNATFESVSGEGVVQNLSTDGICFITDRRLVPGELLELTFSSSGEVFKFKGEVVRSGESGEGFTVGVRFETSHRETEDSLQKLASLGVG